MNRTQLISTVAIVAAGLCYAAPALAYMDPGTGSILLQGLIASIAGIMVVGRLYWQRIKHFFSGLTSSGKNEVSDDARTDPGTVDSARNDDAK
jgi:hypothetical protein